MLGILLTILKIIGIILLVLIGLILLAAAVILLVPIRYHGEGAREEKILSGNVKLTWPVSYTHLTLPTRWSV